MLCQARLESLELVAMQSSTWMKSGNVTNRKWLTTDYCWWPKSGDHQFRLIVYPIIHSVFIHLRWFSRISAINSIVVRICKSCPKNVDVSLMSHWWGDTSPFNWINPLIMRTPPKNNGFHQGSDRHVNRVKHLKPQFHGGKKTILQRPM